MKKGNGKARGIAWLLIAIVIATQVKIPVNTDLGDTVLAQEGVWSTEADEAVENGTESQDTTEQATEIPGQVTESPVAESNDAITAKIVFMGNDSSPSMEALSEAEMALMLYDNGMEISDSTVTMQLTEETYQGFPVWEYTTTGLAQDISYQVKSGYDFTSGGWSLSYIVDGKIIANDGDACDEPEALQVWVAKTRIMGAYRIDKLAADEAGAALASPSEITLALTTEAKADRAYAEDKSVTWENETIWSISDCPQYNPLTGAKIIYRVQVEQNADGYSASYENVEPYENDTKYAYTGGSIVNSYVGVKKNFVAAVADKIGAFVQWVVGNGSDGDDVELVLSGARTNYTVTVNWNDNDRDNRPNPTIALTYSTDGINFNSLTKEALLELGMGDTEADILLTSISTVIGNPNTKSYNNWLYEFKNLPKELVYPEEAGAEGDESDEEPVSITYSFQVNPLNLVTDYLVEQIEGENLLRNTLKTTMSFELIWNDSGNQYLTRQSLSDVSGKLVLKRYITGVDNPSVESLGTLEQIGADNSDIETTTVGNTTQYSIGSLPKYDIDGYPYVYYVEEEPQAGTRGGLAIAAATNLIDAEKVIYKIVYENEGNYAEKTNACYHKGQIINTLDDSVTINVKKQWLDDDAADTIAKRPAGTLYLYRYTAGRDYTTASPVAGMKVELDCTKTTYAVTFPQTVFPRFDEDGNEFIYLVQEVFKSGNYNAYEKVASYQKASDNRDAAAKNIVFNGGVLQNRRTGTRDVQVTKEWKAQAMQDMTASVELQLQRKLASASTYVDVDGKNDILDNFRAEEMTKTYSFSNMPQFNEAGLEYQYRVIETAITINGSRITVPREGWGDDDTQLCTIAGKQFKLEQATDADGNTLLTNRLMGKREVWVKKVWAGVAAGNPNGAVTISVYQKGDQTAVAQGTITLAQAQAGQFVKIAGELERYDAEGREITYNIAETPVPTGYHATYSYTLKEKNPDNEAVSTLEAVVTNTPTGTTPSIEVCKEWYDDADENCRGTVEVTLYHTKNNGTSWDVVSTGTLTKGRDWRTWLGMTATIQEMNEDDELVDVEDHDPTHYYVQETAIIRGSEEDPIQYESVVTQKPSGTLAKVGTIKTDAHYYDIKAQVSASGKLYTFQNIRTGSVNIDVAKEWKDDNKHATEAKQSVTLKIWQNSIYGAAGDAVPVDTIELDGTTDTKETTAWHAKLLNQPKYDDKGVLYLYWAEEVEVSELNNDNTVKKTHNTTGRNSYTLTGADEHKYSIAAATSVVYGEHNNKPALPADEMKITVTNARSESIDFKVHKIWKDYIREGETTVRPDIFLILYRQVGSGTPEDITKKIERVWDTEDKYHWACTFYDLPRYTNAGEEITYTVKEVMPIVGDYQTLYYDETPVAGTNAEIQSILKAERESTDGSYEDVPAGATAKTTEGISRNGTIVNYREAERYFSGAKIWLNVPGNLAESNYPTITLTLQKEVYASNAYTPVSVKEKEKVNVTVADANKEKDIKIDLEKGNKEFYFGKELTAFSLKKYDENGILIRYQVEETSDRIPGYAEPEWDPKTLTIINAYKSAEDLDPNERAYITIEKEWSIPNFDPATDTAPTVNLELWRVITDGAGNILKNTAVNTEISADITYLTGKQKVSFGKTISDTLDTDTEHVLGKLPKYGYNGKIYYYYIREKIQGQYLTANLEPELDFAKNIESYEATMVRGYNVEISANQGIVTNGNLAPNYFDYEITNEYTGQNYISLSGTKAWSGDNSDLFKNRPTNVELNVYRMVDGVSNSKVDITDDVIIKWDDASKATNTWSYQVYAKSACAATLGNPTSVADTANLNRYAPNGAKYIYYVEEEKSQQDNYIAKVVTGTKATGVGADVNGNLTIRAKEDTSGNATASFKNELDYTDYSVKKVWLKQTASTPIALTKEELDMMLPESIVLKVEYLVHDDTLDTDTWEPYLYQSGTQKDQQVTKSLSKSECKKLIEASGTAGEMVVTFNDLPKYDADENVIVYRAIESKIGTNTVASNKASGFLVSETQESSGVITKITNTLETIPLKIVKEWDDNDNQDGLRPTKIDFTIIRDGNVDNTISTSLSTSNWGTGVILYVPKYQADGMTLSVYKVRENLTATEKQYYTLDSGIDGDAYALADPDEPDQPATATNPKVFEFINRHGERTIDVTITKAWSDDDIDDTIGTSNRASIKASSVKVALQRKNSNGEWKYVYNTGTDTEPVWSTGDTAEWKTLNEGNSWKNTWKGLTARWNPGTSNATMQNYEYRAVEKTDELYAYTPTYKDHNNSTQIPDENSISITELNCKQNASTKIYEGQIDITNCLETTSLDVKKVWADNDSYFADRQSVTVQLQYRLMGSDTWLDAVGGMQLELDADNEWQDTFTDLPVENSVGTKFEYRAKEIKIAGIVYDAAIKQYGYSGSEAVQETVNQQLTSTITNTLVKRTDITVTKVWEDDNNRDGLRPATVKIQLIKDQGKSHSKTQMITLDQSNSWSHTFTDLPKYQPDGVTACTYIVKEVIEDAAANSAYTKQYSLDGAAYVNNEHTITEDLGSPDTLERTIRVKNTYEPKKMNIKITKQWNDDSNKYGSRPDSIKLLLKSTTNSDGVTGAAAVTGITNPITIAAPALVTDSWEASFSDLPICQNTAGSASAPGSSQQIYYSVVELKADGTEVAVPLAQYLSPTYDYTAAGTGEVKLGTGGAEVAISGNIADASGLNYQVAVTNTLNTVEMKIVKNWEDYENLYHSRPTSIVFTLQQRLAGSNAAYQNATDAQGTLLQSTILCGDLSTAAMQQTSLTGLPKYNAAGVAYEYRVLETNFWYGGILEQTLSDVADETKGDFETHGFEYSYESATVPISGGYQTTVENVLELERITLSGEKTWEDADNKFASRPANLTLKVYYKNRASDLQWTVYNLPYTINWDKAAGSNRWTYSIEGLLKYVTGTADKIIYRVTETEPSFYEQTAPLGDAVGTVAPLTGDITGVNFTNTLIAEAALAVSKTVDRGMQGDEFEFKVWLSDAAITGSNPGIIYKGSYEVYAATDTAYGTILETKTTTNGKIILEADQTFLLKDLPLNYYYLVDEAEMEDYKLMTEVADRSGQLGSVSGTISEVEVINHGNAKLAISNETTSESGSGTPINVGGKVVVITESASIPSEWDEDDYKPDRVAVAWEPDTYWAFGNSFTLEYTTFDGSNGKVTLTDYRNSDGTLKALTDCTVAEDTLGEWSTWLANGASLSWANGGTSIKLVLADDAADMPHETKVLVTFTPTLAVNNITAQNTGGKVKTEHGQESNNADGVPTYGGNPYPGATTVYGTADAGYQVAVKQLALRNMNDINGQSVLLNVKTDGTFSVVLATVLGSSNVNVTVSGKVEYTETDGVVTGVKITLDELPIPLQFDIAFSKFNAPSPNPDPDPNPNPDPNPDPDPDPDPDPNPDPDPDPEPQPDPDTETETEVSPNSPDNSDSGNVVEQVTAQIKNLIKTGDTTPIIGFGAAFIISGASIILVIRNKNKKVKKK